MRRHLRKRCLAVATAIASLMAIGGVLGAYTTIGASSDSGAERLAGLPANKIGPANGQVAAVVPPQTLKHLQEGQHASATAPPRSICNSSITSGGTVAAAIASNYGEVRSCVSAGSSWVITTLGAPGASTRHGVVAVYACSTTACQSGQGHYSANGFTIITPPYAGGVTVLAKVPGDLQSLIIDDAGHQLTFDAITLTFGH